MNSNYLIKDKKTLKEYIENDRRACLSDKPVSFEMRYRASFRYKAFCYLKMLRQMEYICFKRDKANFLSEKFLAVKIKMLDRKRNKLGTELNIEIPINHIQSGVRIAHPNVILNGYVGEGCVFHGNNVLGNKKTGEKAAVPKLGKNVDVGVGAIIIGDIEIADNCVVGAGAVVTKSFTEKGTVIAGVPARKIN